MDATKKWSGLFPTVRLYGPGLRAEGGGGRAVQGLPGAVRRLLPVAVGGAGAPLLVLSKMCRIDAVCRPLLLFAFVVFVHASRRPSAAENPSKMSDICSFRQNTVASQVLKPLTLYIKALAPHNGISISLKIYQGILRPGTRPKNVRRPSELYRHFCKTDVPSCSGPPRWGLSKGHPWVRAPGHWLHLEKPKKTYT